MSATKLPIKVTFLCLLHESMLIKTGKNLEMVKFMHGTFYYIVLQVRIQALL